MRRAAPARKTGVSWVQCLWVAAGLLLLGGALLTLFRGRDRLVEISTFLGVAMLFSGGVNILIYHRRQNSLHGSCWLLADGMSTALLSVFLLFNQMVDAAVIPFFFGVWELFSGVLKVIDSRELKHENIYGWHWFLGVGTVEILSGIAALLKPVEHFVGMHIVVSLVLFIQSCGYLFKVLIYPRLVIEPQTPY